MEKRQYVRSGQEIYVPTDRPIESGTVQNARFFVEFRELSRVRSTESSGLMERATGIEPTSEAWTRFGESQQELSCGEP